MLINCYYYGHGIEQDKKKAIECYEYASTDEMNSNYLLGKFYYYGEDVIKDFEKAFTYLSKASALGNINATALIINALVLAKMYNLAKNYVLSIFNENDSELINLLGDCYTKDPLASIESISEGIGYYRKSLKMGSLNAMVNLGDCYLNGKGVIKNVSKAFELFSKAANLNNSEGKMKLGHCYLNGIGVYHDYNKGIDCYKKAAELGNSESAYFLGDLYYKKNHSEAIKYYELAKKLGTTNSLLNLAKCYYFDNNYQKAFEILNERTSDPESLTLLGDLYLHGKGVDENQVKAFECYKKAYQYGYSAASSKYCYCYFKGYGVKKSFYDYLVCKLSAHLWKWSYFYTFIILILILNFLFHDELLDFTRRF